MRLGYVLPALLLVAACRHQPGHATPRAPDAAAPGRDFAAHPAVAVQPSFTTLYAVSDIHGSYDRLVALLVQKHLVQTAPITPGAAVWAGGDATLVVVGDLIDKGPASLPVVDLLRSLTVSARGHVIVTLGNHEAEFLADPLNKKADGKRGINLELDALGLDPVAVASGADARGAWLRTLPFAARVGKWFFAHAGDTGGRSLPELEAVLRAALARTDYADDDIIGDGSLLESKFFWREGKLGVSDEPAVGAAYAKALEAEHIVFGHSPGALGKRGKIAVAEAGALLRIDCGMSPEVDDSTGRLLRVRHEGADEVAEELSADDTPPRELWRGH
jgi:hypothetical protein